MLVTGPSGTQDTTGSTATHLISDMAQALQNDPKRIYEFVRNEIAFQPYYGLKKGPERTLQDRAGNDLDQSVLLGTLLSTVPAVSRVEICGAADTITASQNTNALVRLPMTSSDGYDLPHWLDVPNDINTVVNTLSVAGYYPVLADTNANVVYLPHTIVHTVIDGQDYYLDPSFKPFMITSTGLNVRAMMNYSQAALLSAASTGATITADYAQNLNTTNLNRHLATLAFNLHMALAEAYPNASWEEVVGNRKIFRESVTNLQSGFSMLHLPAPVNTYWTSAFQLGRTNAVTDILSHKIMIACGTWTNVLYLSDVASHKVWITYTNVPGSTYPAAQLRLDDGLLATEPGVFSTTNAATLTIGLYGATPGNYGNTQHDYALKRASSNTYVIAMGLGADCSGRMVASAFGAMQRLVAAGVPSNSLSMVSAGLYNVGVVWLQENNLYTELFSKLCGSRLMMEHQIGVIAQEASYSMDWGNHSIGLLSPTLAAYDATMMQYAYQASAFEHGVMGQLQHTNRLAASTVAALCQANQSGQKMFCVSSNNWSRIQPQLSGYDTNSFETAINQGYSFFLPQSSQITLGSLTLGQWHWTGSAYVQWGTNGALGMIIGDSLKNGGDSGGSDFGFDYGSYDFFSGYDYCYNSDYYGGSSYDYNLYGGGAYNYDPYGNSSYGFDYCYNSDYYGGYNYGYSSYNYDPWSLYGLGMYNFNSSSYYYGFNNSSYDPWSMFNQSSYDPWSTFGYNSLSDSLLSSLVPYDPFSALYANFTPIPTLTIPTFDTYDNYIDKPVPIYPNGLDTTLAVNIQAPSQAQPCQDRDPLSQDPLSNEPVDLQTGNYVSQTTDLTVDGPMGLQFTRTYNSNARFSAGQLGYGWTHNFNIAACVHSDYAAFLGTRTPQDALAALVTAVVSADLCATAITNPVPQNWMLEAMVANWAMKQWSDQSVSVAIGQKAMTFNRQPDGYFTPPPGVNFSLTQTNGIFVVQERLGNRYMFNASNLVSYVMDPDGNKVTYTYDASGTNLTKVSCVSFGAEKKLEFQYANGKLAAVVANNTNTVCFGYSPTGDLTQVTDAASNLWSLAYDNQHQITSLTDPEGIVTIHNAYNSSGQVTNQISPTNQRWDFYCTGTEGIEHSPLGTETHYYFDVHRRTIRVKNADGTTSDRVYDGQDHLVQAVDAMGITNRMLYDSFNNLVANIQAFNRPEQTTTLYGYDNYSRLLAVTNAAGNVTLLSYVGIHPAAIKDPLGNLQQFSYLSNGLPQTITVTATGMVLRATSIAYDNYGYVKTISQTNAGTTIFQHDSLGNLLAQTDPLGKITTYAYDPRRLLTNVTNNAGNKSTVVYYKNSLRKTVTNPRGFTTTYTYTPSYHMLTTTAPDGSVISNTYNAADQLISTWGPRGYPTTYYPDALGRVTNQISVFHSSQYTYDPDSRLSQAVDALGNTTSMLSTEF